MAAGYDHLNDPSHLPAFAVVYGIFLALGELGPGNNIGLLASKTSATPLRGHYYGCSAAIGKLGAYIVSPLSPPPPFFFWFGLVQFGSGLPALSVSLLVQKTLTTILQGVSTINCFLRGTRLTSLPDLRLPVHPSRRRQRHRVGPVPLLRLEQPVHPQRRLGAVLRPEHWAGHNPGRGRAVPGVPREPRVGHQPAWPAQGTHHRRRRGEAGRERRRWRSCRGGCGGGEEAVILLI